MDFDILGDRHQRTRQLLDQDLLGFADTVDVSVHAVTVVGEGFHFVVFDVARSKSKHRQEHVLGGLFFDHLDQVTVAGDSNVEITVGCQDDFVDAVVDKILLGKLVRQFDSGASVSRSAGLQ